MDLSALVDEFLPGPGGALDRFSLAAQERLAALADSDVGRPVHAFLHGNTWLGHPAHAIVIVVPVGSWFVTGWYDLRSCFSDDPRFDAAADAALRVGIVGAVAAASTGAAQYLDTRGAVRRETALHAALNNAALSLYVGSWAARKRGRRTLGRLLATAGLTVVGVSGYLGGDISYRHGVGMRPQALRDPDKPVAETSDAPLVASEVVHV
jgi:uncharacterized membrane protein